MKKIAIIGAGAFGFALAKMLGDADAKKLVYIFDTQKQCVRTIAKTGFHPHLYKNIKLSARVTAATSLEETVHGADIIILAVPAAYLRQAVRDFKIYINQATIFLNTAKGLEPKTNLIMSKVIASELKGVNFKFDICAMSGGMIAKEVVNKSPLCAEIACKQKSVAQKVAQVLQNKNLRLEVSTDLVGIELAGAFKNVVAIGAGIFDGLELGASSKSAFISYAAREVCALARVLGAREKTFAVEGLAWWGDLMTTCFGESRNRAFGEALAKLDNLSKAFVKMGGRASTIEGYKTALVVDRLLRQYKLKAPMLTMIYKILYKKMPIKTFINKFITGR